MESKNTEPNSDESAVFSTRRHSDGEAAATTTARPKKRAGRRVFKETRHPIFRGVRRRNNDKWVCELRRPETQARIWLGTYPTPEMAARAHDVAALALRGTSAALNFADSARRLAVPTSLDPKDLRAAAVEAAEEFRPATEKKNDDDDDDDVDEGRRVFYMDEEFDTPGMFADMAQGLLLPPPPIGGVSGDDDVEGCDDVVLWSYSV